MYVWLTGAIFNDVYVWVTGGLFKGILKAVAKFAKVASKVLSTGLTVVSLSLTMINSASGTYHMTHHMTHFILESYRSLEVTQHPNFHICSL